MDINVHGTETILSDENVSLKEKIKELQAGNALLVKEIEYFKDRNEILSHRISNLKDENNRLNLRLKTIINIACYDKIDLEMDELDLTAAESKATYDEIKSYDNVGKNCSLVLARYRNHKMVELVVFNNSSMYN